MGCSATRREALKRNSSASPGKATPGPKVFMVLPGLAQRSGLREMRQEPSFSAGASEGEFQRLIGEEPFWSEPEERLLPSCGVTVHVCRPTPAYYRNLYDRELSAEMRGDVEFRGLSGEPCNLTPSECTRREEILRKIFREAIIQGRRVSGEHQVVTINLDNTDQKVLFEFLFR